MARKTTRIAREGRPATGKATRGNRGKGEAQHTARLATGDPQSANDDPGPARTASEIAVHLDLTTQRVTQLANKGVLPRYTDGKYRQDETRVAYIRFVRRQAQTRASTGDKTTSLIETKTLKAKLDLAIAQGDYININDVEAVLTEASAIFRNELSGLGASVTRDLQLRGLIDEKVNDGIARVRAALEASATAGFDDIANDWQTRK